VSLLCAWCEKEGKPALIAEVEPKEDPTPTQACSRLTRPRLASSARRRSEDRRGNASLTTSFSGRASYATDGDRSTAQERP
jgi:hypothetical protein